MKQDNLTPGKKAQHTAKWVRTMTKWLITYTRCMGARWNLVEFGGKTGAEARGVIDLIAIRKHHRKDVPGNVPSWIGDIHKGGWKGRSLSC